jgi:hypothetical protein
MGEVKLLELWWQLYLYVTSGSGLRKSQRSLYVRLSVQSLILHTWGPRILFLPLLSVRNTLDVIKQNVSIYMTLFLVDLNIDQHMCVILGTRKIMLSLYFLFRAISISNSWRNTNDRQKNWLLDIYIIIPRWIFLYVSIRKGPSTGN